jgi:rubrerythrin
MSEHSTDIEQILRQAIGFERDAHDFYIEAATMAKLEHVKETLNDLAREEVKHQQNLEDLLAGNSEAIIGTRKSEQTRDLKLAEYLVAPPLGEDATFQDVLIVAMKREQSSNEFYSTMSRIAADQSAVRLFDYLAQEELIHKGKVEALYDEVIYRDF